MEDLTFTSTLWRCEAQDAWRFVTVPADLTDAIRLGVGPPCGFGSVRVDRPASRGGRGEASPLPALRWAARVLPNPPGQEPSTLPGLRCGRTLRTRQPCDHEVVRDVHRLGNSSPGIAPPTSSVFQPWRPM